MSMTAADRPSVTDNARDEEPLAWCPGCGDRIPTEVIRERGVCSNCYGTSDDPWAAGRAETTTATTEDAHVLAVLNALHPKAAAPTLDYWGTEADKMRAALRAAGLLATARTRPTREELIDALVMSPLSDTAGTDMRPFEQTADAVLALFRGGAR